MDSLWKLLAQRTAEARIRRIMTEAKAPKFFPLQTPVRNPTPKNREVNKDPFSRLEDERRALREYIETAILLVTDLHDASALMNTFCHRYAELVTTYETLAADPFTDIEQLEAAYTILEIDAYAFESKLMKHLGTLGIDTLSFNSDASCINFGFVVRRWDHFKNIHNTI